MNTASLVSPRGANLNKAKHVVEDVAWLSTHDSYVQAAKRLGEVLWTVEQHLDEIEKALRRGDNKRLSAADILRIQKNHRRLRSLVETAQMYVSRSEPTRCKACLRRLRRSLELHEERNHELLGEAPELAHGEVRRPQ